MASEPGGNAPEPAGEAAELDARQGEPPDGDARDDDAPASAGNGHEPDRPAARRKRRSGGVAVVAGGLLQDLEERLRRDLAPIEERVRPGGELRGIAGGTGDAALDPLVIVLPASPAGPSAEGAESP